MTYFAGSKPHDNFINSIIKVLVVFASVVAVLFKCMNFKPCIPWNRPPVPEKPQDTSSSSPVNSSEVAGSTPKKMYHNTSPQPDNSTLKQKIFHLASMSIRFSYFEIKAATNNFNEALKLGEGGFGKVYKGQLEIRSVKTLVAIKRWNGEPGCCQGYQQFQCEIQQLSTVRHRNLVSLIGYCDQNDEMILVYEYMPHDTLRSHLYKSEKPLLPWKSRLKICIGAARGLDYLHTGSQESIIHRDVKSTNILVDANWKGKIADFGLCKIGSPIDKTNVSVTVSGIKGTQGYLDIEYIASRRLTKKSDVYAFGVVLLEVICARAPIDHTLQEDDIDLSSWARENYEKGKLNQMIDPRVRDEIAPKSLKNFLDIAMKCLEFKRVDRPSMEEVVVELKSAMKLQKEAESDPRTRSRGR